jgi:hypothetical protein
VVTHPEARPTGRIKTVDTRQFSVPYAHPSTEDPPHDHQDERSHACTDGVVYIGYLVEDPGTGEEVEVIEAVPCRRCADVEH